MDFGFASYGEIQVNAHLNDWPKTVHTKSNKFVENWPDFRFIFHGN